MADVVLGAAARLVGAPLAGGVVRGMGDDVAGCLLTGLP